MLLRTACKTGFVVASILAAFDAQAALLNISLTDVEEEGGNIQLAVYNSESTFRKEPVHALSVPAQVGLMEITIADLPAGQYAVMLYHDLDGNGELDTNLMGMPREPWGGSLSGKPVFGPPDWQSASFELPGSGTTISIKLR